MALAQVFDWAVNKVRFYFACVSYVKGFTLNCMFKIISSLRLSELQELIEDIYYISPFYGWENWDQERTRVCPKLHGISLSFSICLFLSYTWIIKMWFWERFILMGNICYFLPISWAKDGNIGYEVEIPKLSISWKWTHWEKAWFEYEYPWKGNDSKNPLWF